MKKLIIIIGSISISYLISCYAYSTFDISKIPTESKYLSMFGVLIIIVAGLVVDSERVKYLEDEIKKSKRPL